MIDMLNGCNSSVSLPDELNLNFFNVIIMCLMNALLSNKTDHIRCGLGLFRY